MPEDYRNIQEGLTDYVRAGTVIFLVLAGLFIFFIAFSIHRRRKLENEKKLMHAGFQQELLLSQLEIREQMLRNISQEIHDNVGQVLSLAKLNLNTIDLKESEKANRKVENALIHVSKAIQDLRDLSRSFNTDVISSMGLTRALENELEVIAKTEIYKTSFEVKGGITRFAVEKELIVFRMVQEVLQNVIKHAAAESIRISMLFDSERLTITIMDNGKGMQDDIVTQGMGIRNLYNRAKVIGGELHINSKSESGTEVTILIPLINQ